jgi:hypothetical protein
MVFVVSDWWWQWSTHVFSVDASLSGYGIVKSIWDLGDVREVGRTSERSRFRLGGVSARSAALNSAGFVLNEFGKISKDQFGYPIQMPVTLQDEDKWVLNSDFPEVPARLLQDNLWQNVAADAWAFSDDILRLEARAVMKAAARVGNCIPMRNVRVLILGDNLGVILAFSRRRARDFKLLVQIRRLVAIGLARGIRFHVRWIPVNLIVPTKAVGFSIPNINLQV